MLAFWQAGNSRMKMDCQLHNEVVLFAGCIAVAGGGVQRVRRSGSFVGSKPVPAAFAFSGAPTGVGSIWTLYVMPGYIWRGDSDSLDASVAARDGYTLF